MANPNPIHTSNTGQFFDFVIDKKHGNKALRLSTSVKLSNTQGWMYSEHNEVMIGGKPYVSKPSEPLTKLQLKEIDQLDGKRVTIRAIITPAEKLTSSDNSGASKTPVSVKYTLDFYADDEKIESHSLDNGDHPAFFYTKITVRVQ